jgi:hypothetical protein
MLIVLSLANLLGSDCKEDLLESVLGLVKGFGPLLESGSEKFLNTFSDGQDLKCFPK